MEIINLDQITNENYLLIESINILDKNAQDFNLINYCINVKKVSIDISKYNINLNLYNLNKLEELNLNVNNYDYININLQNLKRLTILSENREKK